jgi:proteic killer suppression protein
MIKSFKHKGLEQFFIKDSNKLLDAKDVKKISRILDRLDSAKVAKDMDIPGWDFHELKGKRKGVCSVAEIKNWKITFKFIDGEAIDVDYEDYH